MIISVHIPKTAGKSFKKSLEQEYKEKLAYDYRDNPARQGLKDKIKRLVSLVYPNITNETKIIHGHMNPDKYRKIYPNAEYVVFLRDPLATLDSYYHYTREKRSSEHPIHRLINKISFERFLMTDFAQNYYRLFLGDRSLEGFNFVGITENYGQSIGIFNAMYGTALNVYQENVRSMRFDKLHEKYKDLLCYHDDNYDIYKRAVRINEYLATKYNIL
jgi:hypothetical protein